MKCDACWLGAIALSSGIVERKDAISLGRPIYVNSSFHQDFFGNGFGRNATNKLPNYVYKSIVIVFITSHSMLFLCLPVDLMCYNSYMMTMKMLSNIIRILLVQNGEQSVFSRDVYMCSSKLQEVVSSYNPFEISLNFICHRGRVYKFCFDWN